MRAWFLAVALLPAVAHAALPPGASPAGPAPAATTYDEPKSAASPIPAPAAKPAGAKTPAGPPAAAPAAGAKAPAASPANARPVSAPPPATAAPARIVELAPRPTTEVRVQNRYATKLQLMQLFAGAGYLDRGDFFNSPGVQIGLSYWMREWLAFELQGAYFFSWLNQEAEDIRKRLGAIPDSHAPGWLLAVGGRASAGYGKLLVSGTHRTVHFEPQAFLHGGVHINEGDIGPSANAGVGLFFYLSPRLFARFDLAMTWDLEKRSGGSVNVFGLLPTLVVGGVP